MGKSFLKIKVTRTGFVGRFTPQNPNLMQAVVNKEKSKTHSAFSFVIKYSKRYN